MMMKTKMKMKVPVLVPKINKNRRKAVFYCNGLRQENK